MRNKWLKDRIKAVGKSQADLARALGLPTPRVSEMISGVRRISSHEIPQLARFLEWPESTVLQHIANLRGDEVFTPNVRPSILKPFPVMVVGKVQAGVFQEAVELPPDEQIEIFAMEDPRFKGMPHFGLEVVGPSMNQIYPEGSFVVCVPLIHSGGDIPLANGNKVVVERRNSLGEVETTVKELVLDKDGEPWLWPRSDHPLFQSPWKVPTGNNGHGLDDAEDIRVSALVVFVVKSEA